MVRTCRIAALFLMVSVASAARALLANEIPSWACAMPATQSDLVAKMLSPMGIHQLFATGNVSKDLADAASIQAAAEKLEKEEASKAQALVKDAEAAASDARAAAQQSSDLDEKAKKEVNNTSVAKKDSDEAVDLAKTAVSASTKSKNITDEATSVEAVAQMQSQQMFAIAAHLKKDADDEAKQAVEAVDGASLTALLSNEGVFVVFYAPWGPHCQTYVMHDEAGDAENAPIEKLQQFMKDTKVAKFDVDAHKPPAGFAVKYIPTMYWAAKDGARVKYEGDPMDFKAVKAFTEQKHEAGAAAPSGPVITVISKKHEVKTVKPMKINPAEAPLLEKLRAAAKAGRQMPREQ